MVKNISCNICCNNNYTLVFKAKDLNYRTTDEEFNIVKCKNCGLVYINPQPVNLEQYYPKTYIPYKSISTDAAFKLPLRRALELFYGYPCKEFVPASLMTKLRHIHRLLEINLKDNFFLYRIQYDRTKKILDVGCGNGGYLLSLKSLGWDACTQIYGIDFPNEALEHLKEHEHINIIEGNFLDTNLPENFFDIITLRHVLEHLNDPASALKKAFAILKPGGIILINVPNFKSFEALVIFREKWRHIDAPRHLYHFSPETLKKLLNNAGFAVEKILLKRSVAPFIKSLEHYGYHVPKFVEKYIIRNMLKLFKLFGYSGELLCKAVKQ
ncbi:class I SAM-dependent methyltransferase [Dissulfurispira sp.]|uniref:class I SAM-dependent methyltransferase n=1 Tax=Dissulfurispira sp. TaxID=2817609 RepID=UPI002FD989B5